MRVRKQSVARVVEEGRQITISSWKSSVVEKNRRVKITSTVKGEIDVSTKNIQ